MLLRLLGALASLSIFCASARWSVSMSELETEMLWEKDVGLMSPSKSEAKAVIVASIAGAVKMLKTKS